MCSATYTFVIFHCHQGQFLALKVKTSHFRPAIRNRILFYFSLHKQQLTSVNIFIRSINMLTELCNDRFMAYQGFTSVVTNIDNFFKSWLRNKVFRNYFYWNMETFILNGFRLPEKESDFLLAFKHKNSCGCQTQRIFTTVSTLQQQNNKHVLTTITNTLNKTKGVQQMLRY